MLIENGADPDLPCGKVTPIIFVCLAYLSLSYMSNIFLWQGHTNCFVVSIISITFILFIIFIIFL